MAVGQFDAVAALSPSGVRLVCGYVKDGQTYVLDSLFAPGKVFSGAKIIDTEGVARLLRIVVDDASKDLKTPIRALAAIVPPFGLDTLKEESRTSTVGESVTEVDGLNCMGIIAKKLSESQAKRLLDILPYEYSIEANQAMDHFPKGFPATELGVKAQVALADEGVLDSVREVFAKAGVGLALVLPSTLAVARYLRNAQGLPSSYLLLDLGSQVSSCSFVQGGQVIETDLSFFGGNNLTQAIAKTFHLDREEAERYKKTFGISADPSFGYKTPSGFTQGELSRVIKSSLTPLMELVGRIETAVSIEQQKGLVTTGGASNLNGLSKWLSDNLGKDVYALAVPNPGARYRGDVDLLGGLLEMEDMRWMLLRRETHAGILRRRSEGDKEDGSGKE